MSVSTPPRLSPSEHRRTRSSIRFAASRLPSSNETRAPKPVAWCLWTSWPGWSGKPGQNTRSTFRWLKRNGATSHAFSSWRGMRMWSVFVPRRTSHESKGERIAPTAFCTYCSHRACASSRTTATPPTLSEWPFRNFVVECTTTSAPRASGRWKKGLMNVLSTTRTAPLPWATPARRRMSQIFIRGFVGVSIHSIWNSPASLSRAAGSVASRNANSTPYRARTLVKRRWVPPYTLSDTTTRWPAFTIVRTA